MGYYVTHLLQCNSNSPRCILRWHTKPLRAAVDWHRAIEDAPLENNKGGLLNLAWLSGLTHATCDGWFQVNLFDSVKESWQVLHVKNPHLLGATLSIPFYISKGTWKVLDEGGRPGYSQPNTHHWSIFDWWQTRRTAPASLTFPKQRLSFSLVVTSVNFISGGDLEGLGLKCTRSFWFLAYNDFHRVQDLNGGEIMSARHYCKLYPLLRTSLNL